MEEIKLLKIFRENFRPCVQNTFSSVKMMRVECTLSILKLYTQNYSCYSHVENMILRAKSYFDEYVMKKVLVESSIYFSFMILSGIIIG